MNLITVSSLADVQAVSALAYEIWHEHYLPIIGSAQIGYMLQKFQSPDAIVQQLAEGYQYFFIAAGAVNAGYLSVFPENSTKTLHLSKFYIRQQARQKGLGKFALAQVEMMAKQRGAEQIWLTVNKHNDTALAAYQKMGFIISTAVVNDIGQGFVMDDYKMQKTVS